MKKLIRLLVFGAAFAPAAAFAQYNVPICGGGIECAPNAAQVMEFVGATSTPAASSSVLYGHWDVGVGSVTVSVGTIKAGSNDMRGQVTTGSAGAADVITFGVPYGVAPWCVTDSTSGIQGITGFALTLNPSTSLTVHYQCFGN